MSDKTVNRHRKRERAREIEKKREYERVMA